MHLSSRAAVESKPFNSFLEHKNIELKYGHWTLFIIIEVIWVEKLDNYYFFR